MQIVLSSTFYLMKFLSISTCLILSSWVGLGEMLMVVLLLYLSLIGDFTITWSFFSHNALQVPEFAFNVGFGHYILFLTSLSHQVLKDKGIIHSSVSSIFYWASTICISKDFYIIALTFLEEYISVWRPLEISNNFVNSFEVSFLGEFMCWLINTYLKCNIRSNVKQIDRFFY